MVHGMKTADELAYWEQGDAEMYTEEALLARTKLRHERAVVAILQEWWDTALRSLNFVENSRQFLSS